MATKSGTTAMTKNERLEAAARRCERQADDYGSQLADVRKLGFVDEIDRLEALVSDRHAKAAEHRSSIT